MKVTEQYIPPVDPTGGSAVGNSYISTWARCPRDWYNNFYRPYLDSGGIEIGTGLSNVYTGWNLLFGRIFHEGLAAWYSSGIKDGQDTGERSVDAALDKASAEYLACEKQFQKPEMAAEASTMAETMIRSYHDRYGPDSHQPEFPEVEVLCDSQGQPFVEREWKAQLCEGYVYTCRTDLIILHYGMLKTMEHKTTTAYGVRARRREMDMDSQFTGEYWILRECLPEHTLNGVLVNMVLKNRAGNSKYDVAERETTIRTDGQLDRWRQSCIAALKQIDSAIALYEELLQVGRTHDQAAEVCFPDYGTRTGQCYAFGSQCQYLELCQLAGALEHRQVGQYRPRFPKEEPSE